MTLTCNHGYFLTDCALCLKARGECDYGSCTADATTHVPTLDGRGRVIERRPMCARHAGTLAEQIADAAHYVTSAGAATDLNPSRRKGFDWAVSIPGCIQHMTDAQLMEYAHNVRTF